MINSLSKLGLPPNAPPENKVLSVAIAKLVLEWSNINEIQKGLEAEEIEKSDMALLDEACSFLSPHNTTTVEGIKSSSLKVLDQSMIDTIVNFLVRIALSN